MEDYKKRSRASFNWQAETYDEAIYGEHARALYPHMLRAVMDAALGGDCSRGVRVLDMGCGTGALAEAVLEALPECKLVGIDLAENMLEVAQRRLKMFHVKHFERVQLLLADSEKLPFADESFDIAYCCDSFHHYPHPERAVFEAWRVLVPGGMLVIGDCWQPTPARAIMNAAMKYGRDGDVRIYSERELRDLLGCWFSQVTWERAGTRACLARGVK